MLNDIATLINFLIPTHLHFQESPKMRKKKKKKNHQKRFDRKFHKIISFKISVTLMPLPPNRKLWQNMYL